jgi:hypothetical protein
LRALADEGALAAADLPLAARAEVVLPRADRVEPALPLVDLARVVLAPVPEVLLESVVPEVFSESVAVAIGSPIWSRLTKAYPALADR